MRPFRFTLRQKLMAMIVLLTTGVIAFLATVSTSHQIAEMRDALRTRAATYGALVAKQVTSAVAFSDRATATEVLSSVESDDDVAAIALFGADHETLYHHGSPSPWVDRIGDIDARVVDTTGRISAITPVRSLEGPRGMLVIQLSTARLEHARSRILAMAAVTALAALVFGILVAWWIAGRLARRLRAIADVATAAAGGDLTRRVDDRTGDEIGMVARSFDGMVTQLRQLIARMRHMAKRDQERLEGLVVARTAQLDQRNAELRLVFDHVEQGILTVGSDGVIASEYSAAVERWLGPIPAKATLAAYVRTFAPLAADWIEMSWASLEEGTLPAELCLAQLPSRFEVGGRHLMWSYKALADGSGRLRVLVVITDESAVVERERAERDVRETTTLLSRMLDDRAGLVAFCAEADVQVAAISTETGESFGRAVHTLKGISAIENLPSIAELCHDLETAVVESDERTTRARIEAIASRWEHLRSKVAPLLDSTTAQLDVSLHDLERLREAILRGASTTELAKLVDVLRYDRVAPRLERFADQARILASRLCKDPLEVHVEVDPELRLPAERWNPFWTAFVHAVRNALDHGIETSSERALANKTGHSMLFLRGRERGGMIEIELEDRGRGIDWQRVATAARERGLPSGTSEDLQNALFVDGLSTRSEVTDLSGRGVGLGALREACIRSGGTLAIASTLDVGTKLTATWPLRVSRPRSIQLVRITT